MHAEKGEDPTWAPARSRRVGVGVEAAQEGQAEEGPARCAPLCTRTLLPSEPGLPHGQEPGQLLQDGAGSHISSETGVWGERRGIEGTPPGGRW